MSDSQNYGKRGLPISTIFLGAVLALLGAAWPSSTAWAACSADMGKVTINEYNTLGSNNVFNSSYVEVKLLPVPVAPLTTVPVLV